MRQDNIHELASRENEGRIDREASTYPLPGALMRTTVCGCPGLRNMHVQKTDDVKCNKCNEKLRIL